MKDCYNRDINEYDLCLRFTKSNYGLCVYKHNKFYDENGNSIAPVRIYRITNPDNDELKIKNSILQKVDDNKRNKLFEQEYIKRNKIHARKLQLGHAYITSKSELVIYLGKYKRTKLAFSKNIDITEASINKIHELYKQNNLYSASAIDYAVGYCYIPIYFLAYSFINDCLIFEDKYNLEYLAYYNNMIDHFNHNDFIRLSERREVLVKHIDKYKVPTKDYFIHIIKGWSRGRVLYIYERAK